MQSVGGMGSAALAGVPGMKPAGASALPPTVPDQSEKDSLQVDMEAAVMDFKNATSPAEALGFFLELLEMAKRYQ